MSSVREDTVLKYVFNLVNVHDNSREKIEA